MPAPLTNEPSFFAFDRWAALGVVLGLLLSAWWFRGCLYALTIPRDYEGWTPYAN